MRSLYEFLANKIENKLRIDARYFIKGGFWLSLGQIITILLGLITTALLAQHLTENDYGIYKYLLGILSLLSSFSLTGLGQSILQATAKKYYGFYHETFSVNFKYSLFISLFSIIGAVYYLINTNVTLAIGCLLIAVFQPLISTYQFTPAHLQGARKFKESTILNMGRIFFISTVTLITLFYTKNILILFLTYLLGQFVSNIASNSIFLTPHNETPKEIFDKYINYAKHTSARNIISNIAQRADTIIIFTQYGAIELAIYSIATVVPEQIKGSLKNLASLLLPKYAAHTDLEKIKKSVPKRSLQLFVILLSITILYILTAPYIYELIFPKYPEAIFYSQLSALAFPTFILFIPFSIIQSQLNEGALYRLTLYSSIFQIITIFVGILTFGIIGAIIARIIYRIFFTITVYSYLKK